MAKEETEKTDGTAEESAEDLVMTSFRITKNQARALELVSELTGRTKAAIVRDSLNATFKELTRPEAVDIMANAHRERLERQQEELRRTVMT
ncbi:hypothetical protein AB0O52_20550 [Arthrobacter sp. NPDC080073]|uniref:hypothetical protein n=1 Tax=Arthrobacter sp. NPDC080073 TaxID=3155919 RepID=UPI003419284E